MLGPRIVFKRNSKDEAEKPFWISFTDLMTAMMVLFLVVMGVALLAVTDKETEQRKIEGRYEKEVAKLFDQFELATVKHPGIKLHRDRGVIDFGSQAKFTKGEWKMAPQQVKPLREFVPSILAIANGEIGKRVLKRIVVEGYTDKDGTYLYNLNLSLQRSQSVLCAMFSKEGAGALSDEQKDQVRQLFMVGGYSFNNIKESKEESRRVEMRIEILSLKDWASKKYPDVPVFVGSNGECSLQ
jgi:outer membrane protein OmpA-like peptidoglycan-associated protein